MGTVRSASLKRLPNGMRCLKSRVTERGRGDATDVIRVRGPSEAALREGKEEGEGADSGRVLSDDRTAPEGRHQAAGRGPQAGGCAEEDGEATALWARGDGATGEGVGSGGPRMCGKLLVGVLTELVAALERHG